ncbi:MAG TPA: retropepsin-like aspartic protease [Chitinophagaceae bacterium]|nr:retropepsin-like aspartic protease [Chitinophagaceae bacterium]
MGVIRIPLHFEGSVGEKTLYALFDSGSTFSCIRHDMAEQIEEPRAMRHPIEVAAASEGDYVKISEAMRAGFYYNDIRLSDEFMVVPGLSEEAIIGVNTLQKWCIKLDFEHDTIVIDPKVAKLILKQLK